MQIRGAVLEASGLPPPYARSRPLRIDTVELEDPGPGEILVRIEAAGLCHSDLSVINGDRPRPLPMLLGHEAAGIVEALGEGIEDLAVGARVVLVFVPSCGTCPACVGARPALCEPGAAANGAGTLLTGARRLRRGGQPLHHHLGCSAFAQFATVSRRSVVPVEAELSADEAALFGCAVLTGVGAVVNTARVTPGSSVAVVGLGGVGLASLLGALAAGAADVIGIDVSASKRTLAASLGATRVFDGGAVDCVQAVRDATRGGVDCAIEMAGSAQAFALAYGITRRGGTTVTAGLPPPSASFALPLVNLVAEERTIRGCYIGTSVPSRDVPRYVGLYRTGRLPVNRLLSGTLDLDDINEGFDRLLGGTAVRQILHPW